MNEKPETRLSPREKTEDSKIDAAFRALSHRHRREILEQLCKYNGTISISDLSRDIAEKRYSVEFTEIPAEQLTEIKVSLHHSHIPHLEDAGLVDYDAGHQCVSLVQNQDLPIEEFLSFSRHSE